jgi:drug/metabolite transporter (DMT)-like permease
MDNARHVPALLVTGAIWGLTPSLAKLAMAPAEAGGGGVPPMAFAFWQALWAGLILWGACRAAGVVVPWDDAHRRHYVPSALAGFALANLVSYLALRHIPAGFYALLIPLAPMLTVLAAPLAGLGRPGARKLLGTGLGLAGVALAMLPGASLPDASVLGWALFAVLTPVCFAAANLLAVRLRPEGSHAMALGTGTLLCSALFFAAFAGVRREWHWPGEAAAWVEAVILLQGALTALAYALYFRLIARAGGVFTSQVGYVATLAGVAWGVALFAERPGWLALPAAGLVFAGLWLVTRGR